LLLFFPLLASCADMNTMFPQNESYHMTIAINEMPLETSSMIRSGDRIYPSFVISVGSDPDLTAVLAYVRNSRGEVVGSKVRYVIGIPAAVPDETEEADGEYDAGENGEADSQGPAPAARQDAAEAPGSVIEIAVRSFDGGLPYFPLPQGMEIGPHYLVFDALSGRATLQRTEIPVFYLGDAAFSLRDISISLPGVFDTRLIPPGTKVLLEARLEADPRLDPHLIWRSGRTIIREGRLADGAGSILWETPRQAAFHPLRLEVLPFRLRGGFTGISREILLPVSPGAQSPGFFFGADPRRGAQNRLAQGDFHLDHAHMYAAFYEEGFVVQAETAGEPPELSLWHRFEGRLHDSVSAQDEERRLEPFGEEAARWVSIGNSFGLSTGAEEAFLVSPVDFFREGRNHGGGVFLLHVRPIADGTIFSAFFPSRSPAYGGAWLDASRSGDAIVLRLGTDETTVETQVFPSPLDLQNLIPAAVKFYAHPDRLEASISLGEDASVQSFVREVELRAPLSGEGRIKLGGSPLDSWAEAPARVFTELVSRANDPGPAFEPELEPEAVAEAPSWDWPEPGTDEAGEGPELSGADEAETSLATAATAEAFDPATTSVWNEFAVMLSSTPFPRPQLLAETEDEDEAESEEYPEESEDPPAAVASADGPATPAAELRAEAAEPVAEYEYESEPPAEEAQTENLPAGPELAEGETPEVGSGAEHENADADVGA